MTTMRTAILSTLLAMLFAAAGAEAIAMDTTTAVEIAAYDEALEPGGFVTVPVTVRYTYTAGVALVPTAVDIAVAEVPEWATAALSPSTLYFHVVDQAAPGVTVERVAATKLRIGITDEAPPEAFGTIHVFASAKQNGNLKPSGGGDALLVAVWGGDEGSACHHDADAADDAAPAPEEVRTQSSSVAPVAGQVVGALALVGAAIGGFLGLRRRKP